MLILRPLLHRLQWRTPLQTICLSSAASLVRCCVVDAFSLASFHTHCSTCDGLQQHLLQIVCCACCRLRRLHAVCRRRGNCQRSVSIQPASQLQPTVHAASGPVTRPCKLGLHCLSGQLVAHQGFVHCGSVEIIIHMTTLP